MRTRPWLAHIGPTRVWRGSGRAHQWSRSPNGHAPVRVRVALLASARVALPCWRPARAACGAAGAVRRHVARALVVCVCACVRQRRTTQQTYTELQKQGHAIKKVAACASLTRRALTNFANVARE